MFLTLKHRDMKYLLSMAILISSFNGMGQKSLPNKQTGEAKKVYLGVIISPDYDFRTLKNSDGSSSNDFVLKNRNGFEIAKLGYTTGVNVCIKFTNQFGLETGLQYSNKGFKTKDNGIPHAQPDSNLLLKEKFIYRFHYIDIPLKANFAFGNKNIQFISSIGLVANIFINETQKSTIEYVNGQRIQRTESTLANYNKVGISPMVSIGVSYKLNAKSILKIEPTFRYGIIKTANTPIAENLWNAGLSIGYYYQLK